MGWSRPCLLVKILIILDQHFVKNNNARVMSRPCEVHVSISQHCAWNELTVINWWVNQVHVGSTRSHDAHLMRSEPCTSSTTDESANVSDELTTQPCVECIQCSLMCQKPCKSNESTTCFWCVKSIVISSKSKSYTLGNSNVKKNNNNSNKTWPNEIWRKGNHADMTSQPCPSFELNGMH